MEFAISISIVAVLAWDVARRYIAYRSTDKKQIERLEDQVLEFTINLDKALSDHKAQHEAAIKNLVEEMREKLGEMKTKVGIAAANARPRKVARIR